MPVSFRLSDCTIIDSFRTAVTPDGTDSSGDLQALMSPERRDAAHFHTDHAFYCCCLAQSRHYARYPRSIAVSPIRFASVSSWLIAEASTFSPASSGPRRRPSSCTKRFGREWPGSFYANRLPRMILDSFSLVLKLNFNET